MRYFFVIILSIIVFSVPSRAEEFTPEKRMLIDELMEMTGANDIGAMFGNLIVVEMTKVIRTSNPNVDPRVFDIMEDEIHVVLNEFMESRTFNEMYYPIYHKYLTADELREMIEYNKTPLGQKLIKVLPSIVQEGMEAGRIWGETQLGPKMWERVNARLAEEGFLE